MITFAGIRLFTVYTVNVLEGWASRAHHVIDIISQSQIILEDSKVQVRNFIIFNNVQTLNKVFNDFDKAINYLKAAKDLATDDISQQLRLDNLIKTIKVRQFLLQNATTQSIVNPKYIIDIVSGNEYKISILGSEKLYEEAKDHERKILEKRNYEVQNFTEKTNLILRYMSLVTESLLLICLVLLNFNLRKRDATEYELKQALKKIKKMAYVDPLTGLANRRLLIDRIKETLVFLKDNSYNATLMFMDLDKFKSINDVLGHDIGDHLLRKVSERLTESCDESTTIARLGGDEFVILVNRLNFDTNIAKIEALEISKKILSNVRKKYHIGKHVINNKVSIGITIITSNNNSVAEVMKQADIAMYKSKNAGHNNISFFENN